MCFNNDYDWYAAVYFDDVRKSVKDRQCLECGDTIKAGEYFREIEMREHEECQECYGEFGDKADDDEPCDCDEPDYGEQFSTHRCLSCDQFLQAIKAAEIAEGCSGDETQPALESMIESIQYVDDRGRYFDKARELFPVLEANGYLAKIQEAVS